MFYVNLKYSFLYFVFAFVGKSYKSTSDSMLDIVKMSDFRLLLIIEYCLEGKLDGPNVELVNNLDISVK